MPINSRAKGARVERQLRDKLREHGFQARRGQQFSGANGDPDVVCPELPLHWESKGVQNLNVWKAYAQAQRDAKEGLYPVVAHTKNHAGRFLVTLDLDHFLEIMRHSDLVNPRESPQPTPLQAD